MASRNRIKMNKLLFERLIVAAELSNVEIANATEGRFIRRLSDEDAALMAGADALVLTISRQVRMVRISFQGQTLFCVFGLAEPDQLPLGLEIAELTPAIFLIGVVEARIQPLSSISGYGIQDVIEQDFVGVAGYDGHELDAVAKLFPTPSVFRVTQDEPYLKSDHRVLGALLVRSYTDGPIQLSSVTIEKLQTIFEFGSKFIPFRNLIQGLMSIAWENLYLEAYRCLEQLYAEPRVSDLKDQWHSTLPLRDLAALLERHLSWRPKEDDALSKLLASCSPTCLASLTAALRIQEPPDNQISTAEKAARKIYDLRNSVVHYRPIHEEINKSDDEWNDIVSALLDVVSDIYDLRGVPFFEVTTDPHADIAGA